MSCEEPPNERLFRLIDILVFVGAALFFFVSMDRNIGVYDEGLILTGAARVVAGQVPHRDFYTNYGPGQFYVLAFLFRRFGQAVMVERIFDLLVRAAIVAVCFHVARFHCRRWIVAATAMVIALTLFSLKTYGYPVFSVILFALIGSALIAEAGGAVRSNGKIFLAGVATGLAALFRYDLGFSLFVLQAIFIFVFCARRSLLVYVSGTTIIFLPAALFFLAVAPIGSFTHDLLFSVRNYWSTRHLPFPSLSQCFASFGKSVVYLPIGICLAGVLFVLSKTERTSSARRFVFVFVALTAVMYCKGVVRVTPNQMAQALIPAFLLLSVLLEVALQSRASLRVLLGFLGVWTLIATLVGATAVMSQMASTHSVAWPGFAGSLDESRVRGFLIAPQRVEAIRFIRAKTRPNERIFVGLNRHDKIVLNDNLTYFATGRLPATRWSHFDPGLQTRLSVQREMIAEIERQAVRYIVLTSEWEKIREPNDSSRSSGVHLLDDYIRQHYQVLKNFGQISILIWSHA